jgi:hypothetical protein
MIRKICRGAGLALAALLLTAAAPPLKSLKILVPSNDSCGALVTAMNSGDTAAMLNLGGWALGYWSALAEETGRDILHNTTSEGLLDQLAIDCQQQPNSPMSSLVEAMGRSLVAGLPE